MRQRRRGGGEAKPKSRGPARSDEKGQKREMKNKKKEEKKRRRGKEIFRYSDATVLCRCHTKLRSSLTHEKFCTKFEPSQWESMHPASVFGILRS